MNILMLGTGYVGLVTGTCFAEAGHTVVCVDVDAEKIAALQKGAVPIYEPGLSDLVTKNMAAGRLSFTTDMAAHLGNMDAVFIAVGTPMDEDGSADLKYVYAAAREIGRNMIKPLFVVDKSTVPVGTADKVRNIIEAELASRGLSLSLDVVSNPEFLREGNACADFLHPDRIVVGVSSEAALSFMRSLYAPFLSSPETLVAMDVRSAEMTKYASNAMLATRISFMNELANLCERVGADVEKVRGGMGKDTRIGASFLAPGIGYGGSCFPKDVSALLHTGREAGVDSKILDAVQDVNARQKRRLAEKVVQVFGDDLTGRVFCIWGLAFKPETDDMREAPAITIIDELTARGATIRAYDPQAMETARRLYFEDHQNMTYCKNLYDAADGADAILLLTEWAAFSEPDFAEIKRRMKGAWIFDGRNLYRGQKLEEQGFSYEAMGVGRR